MKIQYLTDACVLIEYKGKKLLCDPWLSESICYGALYHYPPINININEYLDVDYIYISHIHEDHLDTETLKFFPKEMPVLIHCYEEKHVMNKLKFIGFTNIVELKHKESFSIIENDFSIEILAADNCDPAICHKFFGCQVSQLYEKSLQIDSMAVVKGGDYVVLNTNDCPYELSHTMIPYILKKYKKVDFLMTSYNGASSYPQCFENFSEEEMLEEKEKIRMKCLNRAVNYCKDLTPDFVLPFAAQRVTGGKLYYLNEFTATTPFEKVKDELGQLFIENSIVTSIIMLNSQSYFDLESKSSSDVFSPPTTEERYKYIKEVLGEKKYLFEQEQYNILKENQVNLIEDIIKAQERMYKKMKEVYWDLKIDTILYLDTGQEFIYKIPMNGDVATIVNRDGLEEPFLKISLDYVLLQMILERKAHWNNAEFGSFLKFYRKPNIFNRAVHHMISYLHL